MTTFTFPPSRTEAVNRLTQFIPRAGRDYANGRNTDNGPGRHNQVSVLSPYIRHRLISEKEVVQAVLVKHNMQAAEQYVQEVLWRTYWKGWLEMRPLVWTQFLAERDRARDSFPNMRAVISAENGSTGIEGFDDWANELVETGYLHNHARMWFASIWIFTLNLPWALGADFFLRHLVDADPASNTLSWRWVAGLQTAGKTYLAAADNISRYTNGRFAPKGLAKEARALTEAPVPPAMALPDMPVLNMTQPAMLLITNEDMCADMILPQDMKITSAVIAADNNMSFGDNQAQFVRGAAQDVAARVQSRLNIKTEITDTLCSDKIIAAANAANVTHIVTAYAPVGLVANTLRNMNGDLQNAGITLSQVRRSWDSYYWPHAKKGFFPFKEQIAGGLKAEGIHVSG
jgi:deoxyribodipyrimidine photo-lyase